MPLWTADAVVVGRHDLGEADRVVVFLTRDRGKKRGVARGARRPRSPFAAALEPLSRIVVTYFEREGRELVRLRSVDVLWSPLQLPAPAPLGCAAYFAELLDAAAPEADPAERLFRLGVSAAEALLKGVPVEPLARYFEYWLLRLQGVYPSTAGCHRCGGPFDPDGAVLAPGDLTLVCRRCLAGEGAGLLSSAALAFLGTAARVRPDQLADVPFDRTTDAALERVHGVLLAAHLERDLSSGRVLRELVVAGNSS